MKTDRQVIAALEVLRTEENTLKIDRLQAKVRTMGPGSISNNDAKSLGAKVLYGYHGKYYTEDELHLIPRGVCMVQCNSLVV